MLLQAFDFRLQIPARVNAEPLLDRRELSLWEVGERLLERGDFGLQRRDVLARPREVRVIKPLPPFAKCREGLRRVLLHGDEIVREFNEQREQPHAEPLRRDVPLVVEFRRLPNKVGFQHYPRLMRLFAHLLEAIGDHQERRAPTSHERADLLGLLGDGVLRRGDLRQHRREHFRLARRQAAFTQRAPRRVAAFFVQQQEVLVAEVIGN